MVGSIEEGERLIAIFDQLFGTSIANAALITSVADLNTKLEESTNLLQRYRDVQEELSKGRAIIASPGTDERILDLERERIALLNQLKRAAEDAAVGVGTLGDAADEAGNDLDKFADDIRKANAAAGEGLADIEFAAAGLDVAEARKEVEAYDRALQENAQETKRAAAEATRLAEARSKGIAALKVETSDLERLVAAHKEGTAEVRRVELAIEAENEMRRLNVALGSETAAVITTEIQRRRELTEAVDMLAAAEERRMDVFRAMNEEEMGRRMGQAEAGGMSAPGTPEDFEREMSEPFENALKSVQAEFTNVFEEMSRGTISSFDDIADAAKRIFQNLNANLLSLAIFDKEFRADLQAQSRQAGLGTHGLTAAAAYTTAAPMMLQLAGAGKMSEGAQMGGAIGAGIGAFGGPAGMAIGGAIGSTVGAIGYGLFGPGAGGNQVSFGGSALGKAGAGGTGEAAKFVAQIDTQLIALMNFRQEKLTNAMLSKAKSTSVQYGEEGPSANDLAALAGARIRPAAKALGFTSAVGRGAPEQQMANLQQAVAIMQQVQAIDLGPLGSELENLKTTFLETATAAKKFGVDNRDELEKQYRFERAAIQRRFASERVGLEAMFGQRSSTSAALAQLKLQFDEAGARAKQLGLSTAGMGEALAAAQEEVRAQARAQRDAIITEARGLADLPQTFKSTFTALMERFAALRAGARELGKSLEGLTTIQRQAVAALQEQRRAQLEAINREGQGLSGAIPSFGQELDELNRRFVELRTQARALGGDVRILTLAQREAIAALQEQRKAQLQAIDIAGQGLTGLDLTFGQELDALNRRFVELRAQARALGGDVRILTLAQREALAHLKREQQLRQDQMALSVGAPFKQLLTPLQEFQEELGLGLMNPAAQMQDAAADFRRITLAAQGGDLKAIESFQAASQRFIDQAGRFGSSTAQVAAIEEVQRANRDLMAKIEAARREAEAGMEDVIKRASQREIDTMRELIEVGRQQIEEIKRLGRK